MINPPEQTKEQNKINEISVSVCSSQNEAVDRQEGRWGGKEIEDLHETVNQ